MTFVGGSTLRQSVLMASLPSSGVVTTAEAFGLGEVQHPRDHIEGSTALSRVPCPHVRKGLLHLIRRDLVHRLMQQGVSMVEQQNTCIALSTASPPSRFVRGDPILGAFGKRGCRCSLSPLSGDWANPVGHKLP